MTDLNSTPKLIWGLEAISKVINRTKKQTHWMLQKGSIPGRLVGGRWVADRDALLKIADPESNVRDAH